MSYQSNIPQPTDQLSQSQQDILDNFTAIANFVSVNHVAFNAGSDEGKHKFITFPVQASNPAYIAGEIGLFNKLPAAPFPLTGVNELFLNKQDGTKVPITASSQADTGWCYLPSGLILKWGRTQSDSSLAGTTITFPVAASIPVFSDVFTVFVTPLVTPGSNLSNSMRLMSQPTAVNFVVLGSNSTGTIGVIMDFHYLAIGN